MKLTYLILNLFFTLPVVLIALRNRLINSKIALVMIAMLILTLIFDNLIIALKIVAYDELKLLGVKLFKAPIEDFFYTVVAVLLMPVIFNRLLKKIDDNKT